MKMPCEILYNVKIHFNNIIVAFIEVFSSVHQPHKSIYVFLNLTAQCQQLILNGVKWRDKN